MKTLKKNTLIIVLAILALLVACNQEEKPKVRIPLAGVRLVDAILITFEQFDSLTIIDKQQNDIQAVLLAADPVSMKLPDNIRRDYSVTLTEGREVFGHFHDLYVILGGIYRGRGTQNLPKEQRQTLAERYTELSKNQYLATNYADSLLSEDEIQGLALARDLARHHEAIRRLTNINLLYWQSHQTFLNTLLDSIYNNRIEFVETAPISVFDSKKIEKEVTEPYSSPAAIINIYRLRERERIIAEKEAFRARLSSITEALAIYTHILPAFVKGDIQEEDLEEDLIRLENILSQLMPESPEPKTRPEETPENDTLE